MPLPSATPKCTPEPPAVAQERPVEDEISPPGDTGDFIQFPLRWLLSADLPYPVPNIHADALDVLHLQRTTMHYDITRLLKRI